MRLDLFLKWSRVILRRTLAKDTCDAGRVTVNGQEAKAGREVQVGDTVSIRLPRRQLTFRVRSIPAHAPGKEAARDEVALAAVLEAKAAQGRLLHRAGALALPSTISGLYYAGL